MLIHFLNNYNVVGRMGNKINIKGEFPGIQLSDFVFLSNDSDPYEDDKTYKIEHIVYSEGENSFQAVIVADYL